MPENRIRLERNPIGAQDLDMGSGFTTQTRNGQKVRIDRVGADTLKYDDTRTIRQAIDEEKAREFAFLRIDPVTGNLLANHAETNTFRIDQNGDLIHDPEGVR